MTTNEKLTRAIALQAGPIDTEKRTVDLCFSTENSVERSFGDEILDHSAASVELARLNDGAPLLLEHDRTKQVGVVVKAWIDDDRKARAVVKFGRSKLAKEIFDDVQDGIRRLVSVGYVVKNFVQEKTKDGAAVFRAMSWEPMEISLVSIPADLACGVGRAAPTICQEQPTTKKEIETVSTKQETVIEAVRDVRASEIAELGKKTGTQAEAVEYIATGRTVEDFKSLLIERQANAKPLAQAAPELGMSTAEVRRYSLMEAIRARSRGDQVSGIELEASRAIERQTGLVPRGFWVPSDVFKRDMTAANSAGAIGTNVGDYIAPLYAQSVVVALGARVLSGLTGNVSLPKGGTATAGWLTETGASVESAHTLGQVQITPKRLGTFVDVSKQLLAQSSTDVEGIVRGDLVQQLSLAIDAAAIAGAAAPSPIGILSAGGVGTVSSAGIDRDVVVDLEGTVGAANALTAGCAYIMPPAVKSGLKKEQLGTSGRFVMEGEDLNGYRAVASTQVTAGALAFGDFSQLIVASFGPGVDLTVDQFTQAGNGLVRIYAQQYADVAIRHAAAFAKYVAA